MNGKEARKAWGEGHEIEFAYEEFFDENTWVLICDDDYLSIFKREGVIFRIKPRTIEIGEYEAPAPFVPEIGEQFYYLTAAYPCGYNSSVLRGNKEYVQFGTWRTKEEIEQVVLALRSVLNERK